MARIKNTTLTQCHQISLVNRRGTGKKSVVHIISKRKVVAVKVKNIVGVPDMFVIVGIISRMLIVVKSM